MNDTVKVSMEVKEFINNKKKFRVDGIIFFNEELFSAVSLLIFVYFLKFCGISVDIVTKFFILSLREVICETFEVSKILL